MFYRYLFIFSTRQRKHFCFPAKEEPVYGQILLFPTETSIQIDFFPVIIVTRNAFHMNSATQILQFFLCTSDLMKESGTFFVVLRQVHRTRPFFWINTISLVKKSFQYYISLCTVWMTWQGLAKLQNNHHFPKQPLKVEIFRYFGISPLSTEFEKHLFVFFSTLFITLKNTVTGACVKFFCQV